MVRQKTDKNRKVEPTRARMSALAALAGQVELAGEPVQATAPAVTTGAPALRQKVAKNEQDRRLCTIAEPSQLCQFIKLQVDGLGVFRQQPVSAKESCTIVNSAHFWGENGCDHVASQWVSQWGRIILTYQNKSKLYVPIDLQATIDLQAANDLQQIADRIGVVETALAEPALAGTDSASANSQEAVSEDFLVLLRTHQAGKCMTHRQFCPMKIGDVVHTFAQPIVPQALEAERPLRGSLAETAGL